MISQRAIFVKYRIIFFSVKDSFLLIFFAICAILKKNETEDTLTKNETLEVLCNRRSCRSFDGRKVDRETLDKILKAGTYAPSGMGRQSAILIAIDDPATVRMLSALNAKIMGREGDPFYGASTVVVVLADKRIPTYLYDGSLVMGNLMNAAEVLGVNSCWIHRAKEEFELPEGKAILEKLGITGDYEGIGHCVLGYGEKVPAKPRKEHSIYRIEE